MSKAHKITHAAAWLIHIGHAFGDQQRFGFADVDLHQAGVAQVLHGHDPAIYSGGSGRCQPYLFGA